MAYSPDFRSFTRAPGASATSAVMDAGLRAYMLRVYNWMASGLVLTGLVAYAIAHTQARDLFYQLVQTPMGVSLRPTPLGMIAMFAPLAFVLALSFGVNRMSKSTVQTLFWVFCAAMGASLTSIFFVYTETSIARVFFITAATFAGMSLWGYTTKTDLTRLHSFLIMGVIGLVIAMVVNIFLASSGMQFLISIIGVLVFTGLAASDTQRIKSSYVQFAYATGADQAAKRSVFDALTLYLNFINIFMFMLQLFGNRTSSN